LNFQAGSTKLLPSAIEIFVHTIKAACHEENAIKDSTQARPQNSCHIVEGALILERKHNWVAGCETG